MTSLSEKRNLNLKYSVCTSRLPKYCPAEQAQATISGPVVLDTALELELAARRQPFAVTKSTKSWVVHCPIVRAAEIRARAGSDLDGTVDYGKAREKDSPP